MSLTIDEYRCKLINNILFARSPDEVNNIIDTALKGLQEHNVNGHIIARFVRKAIQHLGEFRPINYDARQLSNIKIAIARLNQLRRSIRGEDSP